MTLNQIAERIAYEFKDPFNVMLKNNIKFSAKTFRALVIRRDIQANGLSDDYLQRVKIDFIKIDKLDACNINLDCAKVLKSSVQIPQLVRWKNDVPVKFLGTLDGKAFTYTQYEEIPYTCYNRYTSKELRYALINQYFYLFNNTKIKHGYLHHIFVDPSEVNILCEGCYNDDMNFPFPADMVDQFIDGVLNKRIRVINPVDEEVQVNQEETEK